MPILAGPLIALIAVAALALVLRWTFAGTAGPPEPPQPQDFGLLSAVATVDDPEVAAGIRRVLQDAGIRSTLASGTDGISVLVFDSELDQARRLVR